MECPEYRVPGWLDENGNPTSCVGDHPCPGLEAPACITETGQTPAPLTELPHTGVNGLFFVLLAVAVALVVAGTWLVRRGA